MSNNTNRSLSISALSDSLGDSVAKEYMPIQSPEILAYNVLARFRAEEILLRIVDEVRRCARLAYTTSKCRTGKLLGVILFTEKRHLAIREKAGATSCRHQQKGHK
jgi:hypothetical protein